MVSPLRRLLKGKGSSLIAPRRSLIASEWLQRYSEHALFRLPACSSLISHVGTARRDLFEIRIVIKNGLRLQLVAGEHVQGDLLLLLGVGDHQHYRDASQVNAG